MLARLETADRFFVAKRTLPNGPLPKVLVLDGSPRKVFVHHGLVLSVAIYRQVPYQWLKARKADVKADNPT